MKNTALRYSPMAAKRLVFLRGKLGKISRKDLAGAMDVAPQRLQHYESRYKKEYLPKELQEPMAKGLLRLGFDVSNDDDFFHLFNGEIGRFRLGAPECDEDSVEYFELPSTNFSIGDVVSVPRFDASLSAGPGAINDPHAEPLGHTPFDLQWLRTVTTASPEHLAVVRISGDSMEPTLHDGDWVLIDRTQRRASLEGFYAFQVGEDTWIKRLTVNLRDRLIRVVSDNSIYPIQDLPEEDIHIIGRAVCVVLRKL